MTTNKDKASNTNNSSAKGKKNTSENKQVSRVPKVRGARKEKKGIVVSDIQDKTLVVKVFRSTRHKLYKKIIKISKKYYVHDEENKGSVGDTVLIKESRPLSKMKRWKLVKIMDSNQEKSI